MPPANYPPGPDGNTPTGSNSVIGGNVANSDNTYSGGLSFHSPNLVLGASNGTTLTGGFNFDLPLATVAAFTNDALNFAGASNSAAQGGFASIYKGAEAGIIDTEAGASDIAQKAMAGSANTNNAAMTMQNVKPFSMADLSGFVRDTAAPSLPMLTQPRSIAEYQTEQMSNMPNGGMQMSAGQAAASGGASGGSGINWGSIIGTVASFFL